MKIWYGTLFLLIFPVVFLPRDSSGYPNTDSLAMVLKASKDPVKKLEILLLLADQENNYQAAVTYAESAITLASLLQLPDQQAKALNLSGVAQKNWGDNSKSIERLFAALDYYQKSGDELSCAGVYLNIGETYRASSKRDKSMEYLNIALNIYSKHRNIAGMARTYNRMAATCYEKLINLPDYKALTVHHNDAMDDFFREVTGNATLKPSLDSLEFFIGKTNDCLREKRLDDVRISTDIIDAAMFLATNRFDTALAMYEKVIRDIRRTGVYRELPIAMLNMARVYRHLHDFDKSNMYARQALEIGKKEKIKIYILMACYILHDNYHAVNNWEMAYRWLDTMHNINEQYRSDDFTMQVNFLKQENRIRTNEMEIRNNKSRIIILAVSFSTVLISFLVFILILYRKNRKLEMLFNELNQKNQIIKQQNTRLAEANAEKDKFFSIIAHDLKSPFSSIEGYCRLLVEQIGEKRYETAVEHAGIIVQSSQLAMELLKNLLEWSRSQTGRMKFNPVGFDVANEVRELARFFTNIAKQKEITINLDLPGRAMVFADQAMINTVLRNLISNAVKFTKPGGEVLVSVMREEEEFIVSVKDNGVGIEPERIGKLFRIDKTSSTAGTGNEQGTGLGLILCKEFVEKSGGLIHVESEAGKGSTFRFSLRAAQELSPVESSGTLGQPAL